MFINKNELEEITIDLNGNISEQIEEKLCPKSHNDSTQLFSEIWDNMTTKLYMDKNGQIWKRIYFNEDLYQYVAKCSL